LWAHRRLPAKNALAAEDARIIETATRRILEICHEPELDRADEVAALALTMSQTTDVAIMPGAHSVEPIASRTVSPLTKPSRKRNKAHLVFVASQPCLAGARAEYHHANHIFPNVITAFEKSHIALLHLGFDRDNRVSPREHFRIPSEALVSLARKPADAGRQ
jgi:hypothetical protein